MTRIVWASVVVVIVASAADSQGGDKDELKKLQGNWELHSRFSGGKEFMPAKALGFRLRVEGDKWITFINDKRAAEERIVLDPSKTPKTIDRVSLTGDDKTITVRGIYKLEGATLTIAFTKGPSNKRPEKLESPIGSDTILTVYKRK